jgi:protein-arginine kinase activator protein McsA
MQISTSYKNDLLLNQANNKDDSENSETSSFANIYNQTKTDVSLTDNALEQSYDEDELSPELQKLLNDFLEKGTTRFYAEFNMEKIQEMVDKYRQELEDKLGTSPEAMIQINEMVQNYLKQLMEELQNSLDNDKKSQPGSTQAIVQVLLDMKEQTQKPLEKLLSS